MYADILNKSLYTHNRPPDRAEGTTVSLSQSGAASLSENPNANVQGNGKGLGG